MRVRGRRGATYGKDLARVKLRKVLMMVRVVNAFRSITDRLRALTPINVIRSRTTSPDATTGGNPSGSGTAADAAALAGAFTAFPCTAYKISCFLLLIFTYSHALLCFLNTIYLHTYYFM